MMTMPTNERCQHRPAPPRVLACWVLFAAEVVFQSQLAAATCSGDRCASECQGDRCAAGCSGGRCGTECRGDSCAEGCIGGPWAGSSGFDHAPRCGEDCQGDRCAAGCIGDRCGTGCRGESCAEGCDGGPWAGGDHATRCGSGCQGDRCAAGCSGSFCGRYCVGVQCAAECIGHACDEGAQDYCPTAAPTTVAQQHGAAFRVEGHLYKHHQTPCHRVIPSAMVCTADHSRGCVTCAVDEAPTGSGREHIYTIQILRNVTLEVLDFNLPAPSSCGNRHGNWHDDRHIDCFGIMIFPPGGRVDSGSWLRYTDQDHRFPHPGGVGSPVHYANNATPDGVAVPMGSVIEWRWDNTAPCDDCHPIGERSTGAGSFTLCSGPLPTSAPTRPPTRSPSRSPTRSPTCLPTAAPSTSPTAAPSSAPSHAPTFSPTTEPSSPAEPTTVEGVENISSATPSVRQQHVGSENSSDSSSLGVIIVVVVIIILCVLGVVHRRKERHRAVHLFKDGARSRSVSVPNASVLRGNATQATATVLGNNLAGVATSRMSQDAPCCPQPVCHDDNGSPYVTIDYAEVHSQSTRTTNPMYQSAGMRPNQMYEVHSQSTRTANPMYQSAGMRPNQMYEAGDAE